MPTPWLRCGPSPTHFIRRVDGQGVMARRHRPASIPPVPVSLSSPSRLTTSAPGNERGTMRISSDPTSVPSVEQRRVLQAFYAGRLTAGNLMEELRRAAAAVPSNPPQAAVSKAPPLWSRSPLGAGARYL
jgi:hypothetical protein